MMTVETYYDPVHAAFIAEIVRLTDKLDAALELLDGQFAEDLHRQTGIPIERCRELLKVIRED